MRAISERDLAVVIKLVAGRVQALNDSLSASAARLDDMTDEEIEARCDEQELLESMETTLRHLRAEYEAALAEGFALPSYETLTAARG